MTCNKMEEIIALLPALLVCIAEMAIGVAYPCLIWLYFFLITQVFCGFQLEFVSTGRTVNQRVQRSFFFVSFAQIPLVTKKLSFAQFFTPTFKNWVRSWSSLFNKECALFSIFFRSMFFFNCQKLALKIGTQNWHSKSALKIGTQNRHSKSALKIGNQNWRLKLALKIGNFWPPSLHEKT